MNINELRQARAKDVHDARALHEKAKAEEREMSAEETEQFDRFMDASDEKQQQIERQERLQDAQSELAKSAGSTRGQDEDVSGEDDPTLPVFESRSMKKLPNGWEKRREFGNLVATTLPEYRAGFDEWLVTGNMDRRALQVDVSTSGGYLVAPMQFMDRLIQNVDNMVYMRQWANTFTVTSAESMGAPSLEADPADPTWTAEIGTGTEDSTMNFGRRELYPHPLAKSIKISKKLMRMANPEGLVRERLGYKFGVTMENAYLNGNGAGQPLGVFTASNDGIPTSRDVATDNAATAVTTDGLINAKYALKGQYWPRAKWLFHRDGVKMIAKLVDGNGQYLWRESVRAGEPDQLLGLPVYMSEYAPNTFTSGLYAGIVGDFSNYWIVDALDMQIQRLVELYAATNQDGFIGRMESDGAPVVSEAFVRVKLG